MEHYSSDYKNPFEGYVKISPPGYFYQNSDVEATPINTFGKFDIHLEHQVDTFLTVGEEACDPDPLYDRDDCVLDRLLSVIMILFYYQFEPFCHFEHFGYFLTILLKSPGLREALYLCNSRYVK